MVIINYNNGNNGYNVNQNRMNQMNINMNNSMNRRQNDNMDMYNNMINNQNIYNNNKNNNMNMYMNMNNDTNMINNMNNGRMNNNRKIINNNMNRMNPMNGMPNNNNTNNFGNNYINMGNNYYNQNNMINENNMNINANNFQSNNFISNNGINFQRMNNNNNINMNNPNPKMINPRFQRLQNMLLLASKNLNDPNNVNYASFKKYIQDENNSQNISNQKQNFTTQFDQMTNDPNVTQRIIIKVSSYNLININVDQITDAEKRTSVRISGTTLQDEGGEYILNILENFNMGFEEGQPLYDLVYIPKFKNNDKFFVVNFRKSSYIKNFDEAMKDYLSKNAINNNYSLSWYEKQGNELKKYLEEKSHKKKFKDFLKFI